jgi:pimeloyl-ACP methyl ester carboxylesterase
VAYAASIQDNQEQLFHDIANSLTKVKERGPGVWYADTDKECFDGLGCFTKDGPMKHTGILPFTPDKIATSFYAYTAAAPATAHLVDPLKPATFTPVDATKRLAIITHGFGNSYETPELQSIKNNLLAHTNGEVGSVIVVDWKKGAAQPDYDEASCNTQVVGRQLAFLVNELIKGHAVKPAQVYLIGFSLGAQVSGFAGKWSQSEYKWKFGRITGLDAAAPMFENHEGAYLTKTEADFVDAIHSSAGNNILLGEIGFVALYGHVDFFPNSGHHQPMCHNILKISCNHYASVLFYDASLSARATCHFNAFPCVDWKTFLDGKTAACLKSDDELGYWADKTPAATGERWLNTTGVYPYCH